MTIRLNKQDQAIIKELQLLFDVQSEGTMLKVALHQYHHVLHQGFCPRYIKYLFKKERDRKSDYVDIDKAISDQM